MDRSSLSPCAPTSSRNPVLVRAAALAVLTGLWTLASGCGSDRESTPPPPETPAATAETTPAKTPASEPGPDPRLNDLVYLRSQPPSLEIDIALGNYFLRQPGGEDSALVHFQNAARRDSKSPRAWNFVGIALGRLERFAEAEEAYKKAIDLDPFYVKTHVNLGNVYLRTDRLEDAIRAYRVATQMDSTDFLAWLNLGLAYERKTGERTGPLTTTTDSLAIVAYYKAAKCDDSRPEPWERLGWIYFDQKFYKPARERWMEAVRRDPSRDDLRENIQSLIEFADTSGIR